MTPLSCSRYMSTYFPSSDTETRDTNHGLFTLYRCSQISLSYMHNYGRIIFILALILSIEPNKLNNVMGVNEQSVSNNVLLISFFYKEECYKSYCIKNKHQCTYVRPGMYRTMENCEKRSRYHCCNQPCK